MAEERFRILDLDGCIADDAWRIPRINWKQPDNFKRYADYHMVSAFDRFVNEDTLSHRRTPEERVLILTARPTFYRALTVEWLTRKGIKFYALLMRNDDDARASTLVKRDQVGWLSEYGVADLRQITIAYDDRPQIVEMYRGLGIPAEVRKAYGHISAYRGAEA